MNSYVARYEQLIRVYKSSLNADFVVSAKKQQLLNAINNMKNSIDRILESKRNSAVNEISKLNTLNPLSVLMRGYAVPSKDGQALKSINDLSIGDSFEMRMKDGVVKGAAEEIIKN